MHILVFFFFFVTPNGELGESNMIAGQFKTRSECDAAAYAAQDKVASLDPRLKTLSACVAVN